MQDEVTDGPVPQIIIIRRKSGGHDDGHHGSAWKIAYADFMTAMMALFLVMWLINSADDDVKASVANYFNPIELTDKRAQTPGLLDPRDGKGKEETEGNKSQKSSVIPDDGKEVRDVLDQLRLTNNAVSDKAPADNTAPVEVTPGRAYVDPFTPTLADAKTLDAAELQPPAPQIGADNNDLASKDSKAREAAARLRSRIAPLTEKPAETATDNAGRKSDEVNSNDTKNDPGDKNADQKAALVAKAEQLQKEIEAALEVLSENLTAQVVVGTSDKNISIQLTDDTKFPMFDTASAVPTERLRRLMVALLPVIQARGERLVVQGHTDARPFRGGPLDNWRLSLSRAETAYELLRSGGLPLERFLRIEAHAAQSPKLREQPEAAVNRRIELVLVDRVS